VCGSYWRDCHAWGVSPSSSTRLLRRGVAERVGWVNHDRVVEVVGTIRLYLLLPIPGVGLESLVGLRVGTTSGPVIMLLCGLLLRILLRLRLRLRLRLVVRVTRV